MNPVLDLVAKPKLGQREVTLSYVTDWIEKKLCDVVEVLYVSNNNIDLSIVDIIGTRQSVLIKEVTSFQRYMYM